MSPTSAGHFKAKAVGRNGHLLYGISPVKSLASLGLCFSTCKMGLYIVTLNQDVCDD